MGAFDDLIPSSQGGAFDDLIPAEQPKEKRKERTTLDVVRDVGVTALKGAVGLPQSFVGLADIPTGGRVGKALEDIGYRPQEAQQMLDSMYSEPQQEANRKVREADGFIPTLEAALENPSTIATTVGESIPQMLGGASIARGIVAAAPKVAPWLAGAAGEGILGAGSAAEQIRGETKDRLLTPTQSAAAVASGLGTAAFGAVGGKLAQKMGVPDVDTMLVTGKLAKSPVGFVKAVAGAGVSEGVFEELPQSIQEQMWQNYALGKPITEGVGNAAALGLLSGAAMGGAGGGFNAARASLLGGKDDGQDQAPGAPAGQTTTAPAGTPPGQAAPAVGGNAAPASGVPAARNTPNLEAPGVAATEPTEAERALRAPINLTALDRAGEIQAEDARLAARQAELSAPDSGYGPMFDTERQELADKRAALAAERDAITKTWPKAEAGQPTSFTTEAGSRVDAQYALMDAADLVTSHDENLRQNPGYPQELQPRARDRAASEMQISGIVQKLDPARLGLSADAANGAPIVGADGLVESGNARTIALKRVYQANGQKAEDYKQFLRDNAAQFGITPEQIDAMDRPVLVRVRTTPVNRAEFARQANASTVAAMSPSEQAKSDAARIDSMEDLSPDDEGDFQTSRDFIRRFMARLPVTEQAGMIDSTGRLSAAGYARVRNAVLAKAYGDSPVLMRMVESMDNNLRNVTKALMTAAPKVAQMRQAVAQGARFDADITPDLMAAVEELSRLKDDGVSVQDALAQAGMFGDKYSQETRDLLQFLADNARRPRRIADFIVGYMEALDAAGDPNQGSLLGDVQAPAKQDLMTAAKATTEGKRNADQNTERGDAGENAGPGAQDRGQSQDAPGDQGRTQGNEAAGRASAANDEWVAFGPETGTLGIPRREMPQIKGEQRGALIQFLKARGIEHESDTVLATTLKPTQAEYSREKVDKFVANGLSGTRSVLVSSDGHVLDGHHQWLGHAERGEEIPVIRLDAPMRELLPVVESFPGVKRSEGGLAPRDQAVQDFKDAMGDLAALATKHTRAAMIPEDTPGLRESLVKLFDAAFRIVGTDMRAASRWVRDQLRQNPATKKIANFIKTSTMESAALEALAQVEKTGAQGGLFDNLQEATDAVQGDLFGAPAQDKPKVATINGKPYDMARDNFKAPPASSVVSPGLLAKATRLIDAYFKGDAKIQTQISQADRAQAEEALRPLLKRAEDAKTAFDQTIIDAASAHGIGQLIAPLKSIGRAAEKVVNDYQGDAGKISDLLRATVIVDRYSDAAKVIAALANGVEVVKIKNKAGADLSSLSADLKSKVMNQDRSTFGGYADVSMVVRTGNGVLAEVQINVPSMMAVKDSEGHKLYEAARAQADGSKEKAELNSVMAEVYDEAYAFEPATRRASATQPKKEASEAGWQRETGAPGNRTSSNESSSSRYQIPSGNRTNSSPLNDDANSQPGGKLSGTRISSPLADSVAELPANGYTGANQKGAADANVQLGARGTEGQGAGPAQKPGRKGGAARVRAESGGADLFGSGVDDAGRPDARAVGQAGPDGVRAQDEDGRVAEPGNRARPDAGVSAGRDIPAKSGRNYQFGPDDLTYQGSWAVKGEQNVQAVELLKRLQSEGRQATADEQKTLAKFVGWGSSELANNLFGPKLDKAATALSEYDEAIKSMEKLSRDYLQKGGQYRGQYADAGYYQAVGVLRAAGKLDGYQMPQRITRAELDAAKPDGSTQKWIALRDRLRAVMTEQELAEASRSTQYAHYTSKAVVQSMWKAMDRMGFKGGHILEPGAGIGVFAGLMPQATAFNSSYTGIEFDSITGGILKQLFPDERILVESFVDTKLPKNFYDAAIGNPPFSGTKILSDPEYAKQAMSLHDYFFAKSIDRVKPGGLVMYVTSRYTMDKLDDKARKYLADRADLVGAIRLPQTAFKQNAGTEVVTDVIFLRKKVKGETFSGAQAWSKSGEIKGADGKTLMVKDQRGTLKPAMVNEYFAAHPEMVLGQHANTGSMYSDQEYTVMPLAGDIEAHFAKAIENLPADIYQAERGSSAEAAQVREIDFNPKAKKEGNFYVSDAGVLMQRESGVGQRVELRSPKDAEVIKDFVPLRDALKQAHYDQLNDGDWETSLKALQDAYAKFTKKNGQVNQYVAKTVKVKVDELDEEGNPTGKKVEDEEVRRSFPLLDKLKDDPDWTLVAALETLNEDTGEIKPSDFLTKRVLSKQSEAKVATPVDALLTTLNDLGRVDIPTIAKRVGLSDAETIEALGSAVYDDPEQGWVTADDYLSGNVKRKLELARTAAQGDRRYERNVAALEANQPDPLQPSQIDPRLGMNWIPGEVYEEFVSDITSGAVRIKVEWSPRTKNWDIEEVRGGKSDAATGEWGTLRRNVVALLDHAVTGRPIRIESKEPGSDKPVFDPAATEAANEKLKALHEKFASWVFSEPTRTDKLVRLYNDKFNTNVARKFDGSHLTLPGTSTQFNVFDHVKRGAWRIIQSGNTYLAHAVGSGKTFQMVISAMEQKRLGLIKKPMVVVPNHMLKQFAHEWQQLYPAARLMVADEHNFHTDNRRRFVSRVAMSDLDGVVITHSAFKLLDLDPEFKSKMIEEQLEFFRASLEEAGVDPYKADYKPGKNRDPKIKRIEKQIENMEQKLEAAMSSQGKDKNVRFDELGVDFLYVDEAHEYRKLDFTTARQVKGISPQGSGRAFDLYMKSRYLEQKNPGRSLVLASGTPVTNTVAELYTVQKMLGYQALVDKGIEDFDSWAAMFGREKTALEPNAAGKYELVTRFQDFANVPELTQMFREFADVLTSDHLAEMLGDKRPKVEGGARSIIVTPETQEYEEFRAELETRMEISKAWKPSKDEPNNPDPVIRIIGDGRLAAIDMRFIKPSLPSNPDSKLNRMIDDVIAALKDTADYEYTDKQGKTEPNKGAAAMVFSDLGFGEGVAAHRGFNARAWFEKRLRDAGIPMGQVAFMSDFKKSSAKLKLFSDVNAGRVRLLIGSSKNMGTGVNAQQRLKDLFHLDSPWYPADLEQREGRIIRQGNKNPLVRIKAYAAKGTYDQQMWGQLANKQMFIDKALSGDPNVRKIEDAGSADLMAMVAGMVAKDPRVLQLAGLNAEVAKMQRLYQAHEDARSTYRGRYGEAKMTVEWNEKRLPVAVEQAGKAQDLSGDNFKAKVGGKTYTERAKWAEDLIAKYKDLSDRGETQVQKVGEISGFDIAYGGETVAGQYMTKLMLDTPNPIALVTDAGTSPVGVAMRAQNAVIEVARQPAKMRERITEARAQMDGLSTKMNAPFPMAQMLADKIKERDALIQEMAAEGKEEDKKPAEDTTLSRGAGGGMSFDDLSAMARRIKAKMPNMSEVVVLEDPSQAPRGLREYIIRQDAWDDVEGAMHDGKLYLFASGLSDVLRAEHVLAEHEAAHLGLRAVLGSSLKTAMNLIYANNPKVRKAAVELQRRGKLTNAEAVEEVIVDIPSADLARLQGWRKVVALVRDWMGAHGFERISQKLTDWLDGSVTDQQRADLFVAELVRGARDYVRGRQGMRSGASLAGTRLATSLADDIEKQEKWLQAEAKARGYADIEDLLEKNYPLFEKLATLWREKNPADGGVMLSRGGKPTAADRAEKIISQKAGSAAPMDAIARFATKATGIERLTGAIYRRAAYLLDRYTPEQIKAGLVADYGVPEAVIDQRAMLQGRQRVQLRKAGALIEKLSTLTRAESRVAYEWMNMDGADPKAYASMMQGLPEESVKVLQEVQQMIDKLSREAVALGQLSQDAFERNRFAYLRRSYAKHVVEQTAGEKAKRSRVISILGDQYKGRGMTEAAPMDKIKATDWWKRKEVKGKADTSLKGEKFIRLERRAASGEGVLPLAGMDGKQLGRLLEVAWWPAGEALPAKYADWSRAGTWEVRDTKGGNVVFWRDFTKEEREQMGEVDEARFAIAKTLHGMVHDVEVGRYLEWIAQRYSKKEGETIPGKVVEASERYRDTFAPNEWVKVPDTKIPGTTVAKYGKLAGSYIPGPIWNDLRQVVGGQFKPLGETYAKILTMWKTAKTALSPAVHMNNVMSNMVMADWHDVSAAHVAKALRLVLAASQRDGRGLIGRAGNLAARAGASDREAAVEILNRYKDSGGDIGSWATNEIARDQLEPLLASLEKELAASSGQSTEAQVGVMAALQHAMLLRFPSAWEAFKGSKPGKVVGTEAKNLIELYQSEDDVFRLAAWLKAKEDGNGDLEAGKASRKSFLDYHINAPWVQAMRSSGWPFISFTYRAVPMMLDVAANKPHKLLKLMVLAGGINALGVMMAGGGDDEERKLLPEEKAGRIWGMVPKLVRMPWNDANGHPVYLDIRRFIPVGDVFDTGQGHSAVPVLPGLQPGGPLALFAEIIANRSMFTGQPITLDTDTPLQKATKVADYLYKAFAPNVLGLPGTYATTGVLEAAQGKTDAFGREQSVAQAVASSFGVKLGSYPADVMRLNLNRKAQAELMEIDRNITQLKRQRLTNRISQKEFEDSARLEQSKQQKVMDELRKKVQ